jgi:hypothetical protein
MIDMEGQKYGRLLVGEFAHNNRFGGCHWNVTCECGNTLVVNGRDLRRGHTLSCGCLHREDATTRMKRMRTQQSIVRNAFRGTELGKKK